MGNIPDYYKRINIYFKVGVLKILLIGVDSINMPVYTIGKGFRELGHITAILNAQDIFSICHDFAYDLYEYDVRKRQIKLSSLSKIIDLDTFDMVFIQQLWLHTINDLDIPVYYYHSEPQAPVTVKNATNVGLGYVEAVNQLKRFYPREFFSWKTKNFLWFGVDPSQYTPIPDDEKIPGVHFISNAEHRPEATREDSPYWSRNIYMFREAILKKFEKDIIVHPYIDYLEYTKLLPTFESVAVIHGNGCYPNQRAFEALAAGCKIEIYHENEMSRYAYRLLGPMTRENILANHTYLNRAKQILYEVAESG